MTDTPIDRVRAWLARELPAEEAARLEREIAADPELAGFVAAWRDVERMTAPLCAPELNAERRSVDAPPLPSAVAGPAARAPLGPVAPTVRPTTGARWRRVAAVLLFVAGASALSALGWQRWRLTRPLRLAAIPLALAPPAAAEEADPPAFLADYAPVADGAVRWLSDLDEARRAARATGRPLFVFGFLQMCPWCRQMKAEALAADSVLALVARTLPVGIDLGASEPAFASALMERGYPFLEIEPADGGAPYEFHGLHDTEAFRAHLEAGLARARSSHLPAWEAVRARAALLERARAAEDAGRLAEAQAGYDELAYLADQSAYERAGLRGARRIAAAAGEVVERAREAGDSAAARALLADALPRFAGTRYAGDLAALLERTDALGRFPELAAPSGAGH